MYKRILDEAALAGPFLLGLATGVAIFISYYEITGLN